jgi:hypothetical protein
MPNTLAHIGVQSLVTRKIVKNAEFKWILIGCIVPDLPWIMRRIIVMMVNIDPFDLKLYAIVQSTFLFCLFFCLFLSTLSTKFWRTFSILSLNVFFHLILDALQIKWGNGVHLFAPINWNIYNLGLFWPESTVTYLLTSLGLIYFWYNWRKGTNVSVIRVIRPYLASVLLIAYLLLPLLFLTGPENANNHFIMTLKDQEHRVGQYIEIDRAGYLTKNEEGFVKPFSGELIKVKGILKEHSGEISIKGRFISNDFIDISEYHFHNTIFRDWASYIGLALVIIYLIRTSKLYPASNSRLEP